jgi:predicted GIY-YIG superfamily endonuclease
MESNTEEAATASQQTKEGIIYLLMKDNNIYIGSTIQDLKKRMYTHKKDSKTKNNKLYKFIRDTGGIEKLNIQTIEKTPIETKKELLVLEQYYKNLYEKTNNFIILNSYECYLNINTSNRKEYNNIYSKTPKRQEYLKNYYRLYKNKINNIENTNNI